MESGAVQEGEKDLGKKKKKNRLQQGRGQESKLGFGLLTHY